MQLFLETWFKKQCVKVFFPLRKKKNEDYHWENVGPWGLEQEYLCRLVEKEILKSLL